MVTLPTGAGKTRVAVEAVVSWRPPRRLTGPIVWIAQSEELCEQAVQAWAYVWRAIGVGALVVVPILVDERATGGGLGTVPGRGRHDRQASCRDREARSTSG